MALCSCLDHLPVVRCFFYSISVANTFWDVDAIHGDMVVGFPWNVNVLSIMEEDEFGCWCSAALVY